MAATTPTSEALVARPHLVGRLSDALDHGGVLLVAPAGYGKTSVLAQTLATRTGPTVWISCTAAGDGDAGILLLALVERLREVAPGSADVLAERLEATLQRVDVAALARTLRSELEELVVEPVVVVLDDAEALDGSPEAVEVADILLHADPRALRLAVASRRPLAVRAAKLLAAGRVAQLGVRELAFSDDECGEILRRRSGRASTTEEVDAVMASTEGWPLGVVLSAVAPGHAGTSPHAGHEAVFAFLDEEVLGALDDELRRDVLDAAVAPDLNEPMLQALELPADLPARAQRVGLVLRRFHDQGTRWAFHPLVREFLFARLTTERSPAELRALHARTAASLAAAGREREAVEHWLDAGYWRAALAAAVHLGPELQRMAPETIRTWLARLPPEGRDDPGAQLMLGQLEWSSGRHERAIAPLRAAVAGYDERIELAPAWLARWILCDALFTTGGFDEILRLTEGWDDPALTGMAAPAGVAWYSSFVLLSRGRLDLAAPLLERLRADLVLAPVMRHLDRIFMAYREMTRGRVEAGLDLIAAAIEELEDFDPGSGAWYALMSEALLHEDCGQRDEALQTWERLADEAERAGLVFAVNAARWARAFLYAERGDLSSAEAELHRAGVPAGGGWHDRSYYTASAAIALLRDEPAEAVAAAERALEVVRESGVMSFRVWTACDVAPVLVGAGAPQLARTALDATLQALDETVPHKVGRCPRARLLAVRAWVRSLEGDVGGADADLELAWAEAAGSEHHIVRREWARLEPLIVRALEDGRLDAVGVIGALQRAFPGGAVLVRFVDHSAPEVRRAALAAAISSGHPDALARLAASAADADPAVAAAAAAAQEALRRAPPPLMFRLLGGFGVRRATWDLDHDSWGRPLVARLVRFLVAHRDTPVTEDVLFDTFWPGKEPSAARRNLAVALSLARKALDVPGQAESVIQTDGRMHRLALRATDHVDADEFEAAASEALAATGAEARPLLERAEALWAGDPLPEERYTDWTFAWRERLTDRYMHVLAALTQSYATAGRTEDALRLARKSVELDPLNEAAQRELIASYARAGRRNHALRQFLACRRALIDELGIEPSQPTVDLHERVLAGTPV
jgi:DNA-binding SARP family transcriptional activator